MTKFVKGQWATDADTVRLSMPFAKVDQANRLVSGYATLDNVDSQGDVVLAEASAKAFSRARGNLREMHQSIAVGKVVDFREDEFFDTESQKFYRGIYVTARVSVGAEDTWQKVLDGTLSGFSIGGNIVEASNEFVKEANGGQGANVRFIKDYDLVELSLVDNPANQLANVFSIQKSATGSVTVQGMIADTVIENVFYCLKDKEIQAKSAESATCLECGEKMENIGWFESGNDRAEKVNDVVAKFLSQNAADENANGEGGVEMAKKDDTTATETVDETVETTNEEETDVETPAEPAEETVEVEETTDEEEDAPVEEVADEEEAISKKIDELHDVVKDTLEKSRTETGEQVAALEKKIDEINDNFAKKASELEEKLNGFGEKLETAKSRLASFEKSLDSINSSEAFRKSADLEESGEKVQKQGTMWGGAFSGNSKFSVDNIL